MTVLCETKLRKNSEFKITSMCQCRQVLNFQGTKVFALGKWKTHTNPMPWQQNRDLSWTSQKWWPLNASLQLDRQMKFCSYINLKIVKKNSWDYRNMHNKSINAYVLEKEQFSSNYFLIFLYYNLKNNLTNEQYKEKKQLICTTTSRCCLKLNIMSWVL